MCSCLYDTHTHIYVYIEYNTHRDVALDKGRHAVAAALYMYIYMCIYIYDTHTSMYISNIYICNRNVARCEVRRRLIYVYIHVYLYV